MPLFSARKLKLTPLALVFCLTTSGVSTLLLPITIEQSQATEATPPLTGVKQSSSKRLALVVGVDDYPEDPLKLPVNDAKLVEARLKSAGFEVTLVINPTKGDLTKARDEFIKKINSYSPGDKVTALFFFAGHGVQIDGHNYLIPAKFKRLSESSKAVFIDQAMDAQQGILNYLSESKASQVIFVLDACRDNPVNPGHRGSRGSGLAKMSPTSDGPDTFILFAASPGQVAIDGVAGASNSPFTQAFTKAISQPGSSLTTVFQQVYEQVKNSTNGEQRPYQEGILFNFQFLETPVAPILVSEQTRLLDTGLEKRQYDIVKDGYRLLKQTLAKKSIADITKAAENGDAEAQYLLGIAYNAGEGVTANPERTAYWLRRSATRGFSRAQFAYGQRLYWGWGETTPNKKEGFDWWLVAAENNNASAMLAIGETYLYGREGVPGQDLAQAEKYFNQALSIGALDAETSLGRLYTEKAKKAQIAGDKKTSGQASEKKLAYFQNAAQKGSSDAMYLLAQMYRYGDYVKVDLSKAIEWYKKSITAGDNDAAVELAQLYADESTTGLGKAQPEEAAKYFRIAINRGSKTAGVELADLIRNGKIKATPQTSQEAIQIYQQAVVGGSLRAATHLSDIYLKGQLAAKDLKKAEQYALKALDLEKTTKPDSEDAWPMYLQTAYSNLLRLYKEEKLQPAKPQLLKTIENRVGSTSGMKRFTVSINCGTVKSPFHIYVWDWKLDESPTNAQFTWVEKARGCEVPKDVVESFQKLYKIARDNNVSFQELTVYALGEANKKK
ncbi:DUF2610 domain-containing protein [Calothrix sp. 336/3]|uniref:DUF2610 domain-containing protein n=1 Tax=Calothrix sp. 336/3 TaxID=1337936 RepID=UPI0006995B48|nr:DUF2610 domain-containing protein [Calothrix sp. 336/3]